MINNNWFQKIYENNIEKVIEYTDIQDFPIDSYGFIYIITHLPTGKCYLGKKALYHNIKKKLTKKEKEEQKGPGRKSISKVVKKESDWKTYYGSNLEIKNLIKEKKENEFKREIIKIINNKKLLTYFECKLLFEKEVLENNNWFNDNIQGRFFKKDFEV
jgi:hypothetical protein